MKTRLYRFALPIVITGLHQSALAMEAALMQASLTKEIAPHEHPAYELAGQVKRLRELSAERLVQAKPSLVLTAGQNPDLEDVLKEKLINAHAIFFADLFEPCSWKELSAGSKKVRSVSLSHDGSFALAITKNIIRLWDLKQNPATYKDLDVSWDYLEDAALSPCGNFAFTGNSTINARLWDLTKNPPTHTVLEGHEGNITAFAYSQNGKYTLSASDDKVLLLWDFTQTPLRPALLNGPTEDTTAIAFGDNGNYAITGSADGKTFFWDLQHHPIIPREIARHEKPVLAVSLSHDGSHALSSSKEKTVIVNPRENPIKTQKTTFNRKPKSIALSADGTSILEANAAWPFLFFSNIGHSSIRLKDGDTTIKCATVSSDGRYALFGCSGGKALLYSPLSEPKKLILKQLLLLLAARHNTQNIRVLKEACEKLIAREFWKDHHEPAIYDLIYAQLCKNPIINDLSTLSIGAIKAIAAYKFDRQL